MVHRAKSAKRKFIWSSAAAAAVLAGAAAVYATPRANHARNEQEKDSAREAQTDHATSLTDQTDLSVTVKGVPVKAGFALGSYAALAADSK